MTVTETIRAVLADGDWHTLDELVAAAGHLIAPGRAYRTGEQQRARDRYNDRPTPPETRTVGDDEKAIATGRRHIIRVAVKSLATRGTVERRADGRYRKVDRP